MSEYSPAQVLVRLAHARKACKAMPPIVLTGVFKEAAERYGYIEDREIRYSRNKQSRDALRAAETATSEARKGGNREAARQTGNRR